MLSLDVAASDLLTYVVHLLASIIDVRSERMKNVVQGWIIDCQFTFRDKTRQEPVVGLIALGQTDHTGEEFILRCARQYAHWNKTETSNTAGDIQTVQGDRFWERVYLNSSFPLLFFWGEGVERVLMQTMHRLVNIKIEFTTPPPGPTPNCIVYEISLKYFIIFKTKIYGELLLKFKLLVYQPCSGKSYK